MSGFKFRLEKLHWLRVHAEREAMGEVARSVAGLARADALCRDLAAARDAVWSDLHERLRAGRVRPEELPVALAHAGRLGARLQTAGRARAEAGERLRAAQEALQARQAERKALDGLEERAHEEHREEVRRREALAMDEVAGRRHARRSAGGGR